MSAHLHSLLPPAPLPLRCAEGKTFYRNNHKFMENARRRTLTNILRALLPSLLIAAANMKNGFSRPSARRGLHFYNRRFLREDEGGRKHFLALVSLLSCGRRQEF